MLSDIRTFFVDSSVPSGLSVRVYALAALMSVCERTSARVFDHVARLLNPTHYLRIQSLFQSDVCTAYRSELCIQSL